MPQIKATVVPLLTEIAKDIQFVIENSADLIAVTKLVATGFLVYKSIQTYTLMFNGLQKAIQITTIATKLLFGVMSANPIMATITVIGLLTGAVIFLWKNWDKVTESVKKAFQWIGKIVKYSPIGLALNVGKSLLSKNEQPVQKNAVGTTYSSGGLSLVGENGPELVSLPRGSSVASTEKTQKLISSRRRMRRIMRSWGDWY